MTAIPKMKCVAGCNACCGPVPFNAAERAAAAKRFPLVGWDAFDADHWIPKLQDGATCAFSTPEGCAVYDTRPTVCRLFGVVDHPAMKCPQGCKPKRLIKHEHALTMLEGKAA